MSWSLNRHLLLNLKFDFKGQMSKYNQEFQHDIIGPPNMHGLIGIVMNVLSSVPGVELVRCCHLIWSSSK